LRKVANKQTNNDENTSCLTEVMKRKVQNYDKETHTHTHTHTFTQSHAHTHTTRHQIQYL